MVKQVRTRFAPSPTGKLHIGNARVALNNWLYAKQRGGEFILRFDDTDLIRSKEEYKQAIIEDLGWLGLSWDVILTQSTRLERYDEIKTKLLSMGRLYPCFETIEELDIKRKLQLSSGKPPIYDRASLKLSKSQIEHYEQIGRKPHYRFLVNAETVLWDDMIKGEVKYLGENLGDPIVIREDGSMTYMLCSVVDDIDYDITDIIRGEDHVTNTAIQIDMLHALGASAPHFAHLSLIKAKDEKISKRIGGFEIESLRNELGFEAMTINSFFSMIGSSQTIAPYKRLTDLAKTFDIFAFSKSPTTYMPEELVRLNHKLLIELDFEEVRERLEQIGMSQITKEFWLAVRPNLHKLNDIKDWWNILYEVGLVDGLDKNFIHKAIKAFPDETIDSGTWSKWISALKESTGKKGPELFMPLRLAITGLNNGPELKDIISLIGREEIIARLTRYL